ncbi:hypothetical protein RJ639_026108, partial [Escallonia herrerae]
MSSPGRSLRTVPGRENREVNVADVWLVLGLSFTMGLRCLVLFRKLAFPCRDMHVPMEILMNVTRRRRDTEGREPEDDPKFEEMGPIATQSSEKVDGYKKIDYMLTIPKPIVDEAADEVIKQTAMKQKQRWEEDDTYCKGYILGGLSDTLYDVYEIKYANSTAKELWDDLDSKYKMEDAGNKKFLISKLFDFRMVDSKSVITQIHELQMIMNLIISEGHSLDESFQVSTIISKLPLAWKECRKELKQKKDAMTMQELVKYIQVVENSRNLDRLELEDNKSSKALVIDHGSLSGSKHKLD